MEHEQPQEQSYEGSVEDSSIYVSNISKSATKKNVSDFFSFCGEIEGLSLATVPTEPDPTQVGVVTFKSPAAARTALLLSNALIQDRPISVQPYSGQTLPENALAHVAEILSDGTHADPSAHEGDQIVHRDVVPAEQRSNTSVIASLLAAGYTLGEDAIAKARSFDEKHGWTGKVKQGAAAIVHKTEQFSEKHRLNERATNLAQAVDDKLGVRSKVDAVSDAVNPRIQTVSNVINQGVSSVANTINTWYAGKLANPSSLVSRIHNKVSTTSGKVVATTQGVARSISSETKRMIDEKHAQKGHSEKSELLAVDDDDSHSHAASSTTPALYPSLDATTSPTSTDPVAPSAGLPPASHDPNEASLL